MSKKNNMPLTQALETLIGAAHGAIASINRMEANTGGFSLPKNYTARRAKYRRAIATVKEHLNDLHS